MTSLPISRAIPEKTSAVFRWTLTDTEGAAIPGSAISSIEATLVDALTGLPINSRSAQSVLNTNGGTMALVSGLFTLALSAADTVAVGESPQFQPRRLTLKVTFESGTLTDETEFYVRALPDVS